MNLIDLLIGFVWPTRGLRRARARAAMRIYEGASPGRRANSWRAQATSANTEIKQALGPLRDRARDLVRNTPHAARMLDIFTAHIIGTGIRPVSATGKDKLDDRVERVFKDWQDSADIEGVDSFYSLQRLALRSMMESGEVVIRMVDRTKQEATSAVPLHLQVLESDFIDSTRDGIMGIGQPEGQRTRLGVGLGDYDVRTGLWLFNHHPGEQTNYVTAKDLYVSNFVATDQLIHLFGRNRPGQVRGISWFAPMITTARDFSDLMDAVTVKARIEACFAAFITQADDLDSPLEPSDNVQLPSADNPNAMGVTLEPGMMKLLRPGQDVKFAQPTSTSQIESVMMFDLMSMAAGVGVTYDQLSGDLRGANYSSLRAGKIDFRALCEQIQELILIPRVCNRIWKRFIERAILAGELADRKEGYPVEFITPAWQSINPKFDEDAEMRSVRAGRMTPQQYMAGWGGNWRRNIRAIKEFYDYLDEKEVAVEIDVRNYNRAGSHQPPQPGLVPAGTPTAPGESPPAGAPGAPANGAANGTANGSTANVTLVDANGDPIDISDLTDLLDQAEARGIDLDDLPFRLVPGRGNRPSVANGAGNSHIPSVIPTVGELARAARSALKAREFVESEHPRDDQGQFTESGDGEDGGGSKTGGSGGGKQDQKADTGGANRPAAEASSGSYTGTSGGDAQGSGGLKGATITATYAPTEAQRETFEKDGTTPLEYSELGTDAANADVFHASIAAAAAASKYGSSVTVYDKDSYVGMRMFLADDGKTGFALNGNDIISGFKHPDSKAEDIAYAMLPLAVEQGGRRLECFDTVLPEIYGDNGFIAVSRLKWDDAQAPKGWDKALYAKFNNGEPDVVFMAYDPANAKAYEPGDGKLVDTYDEAVKAQTDHLKSRKLNQRPKRRAKPPGVCKLFDETGKEIEVVTVLDRDGKITKSINIRLDPAVRVEWNEEDHPRDQDGKFTDSGGGDTGGGDTTIEATAAPTPPPAPAKSDKTPTAAAVTEKATTETAKPAATETAKPAAATAAASPEPKEKKLKAEDFINDKIELAVSLMNSEKFLEQWESKIGETPGKFKEDFLGGLDSTMRIEKGFGSDSEFVFRGTVMDDDGHGIGTYTRSIDFEHNKASSDYFKINSGYTGKNVGKQVLAANVAMYEKLGLNKVEVHANIDVGGYAWARYGYVPTENSWRSFHETIQEKIDELAGGGSSGYTPESWSDIGDHQQNQIERAWARDTFNDFLDSEIESWRESGQPLEDAKTELTEDFNNTGTAAFPEWAHKAIDDAREKLGDTAIPYTNAQLLEAISLDYSSRYQDGRGDVDVSFDDEKLGAPEGYDPAQGTLPGVEPEKPGDRLTEEMRDTITSEMSKAWDKEAESKAGDMEPPDYLRDNVSESQSDYWATMEDYQKFDWAKDNGHIEEQENGGGGSGEIDESTADDLRALIDPDDPKSVWAIADSAYGKEILLGTDWYGELDLHDAETMERFNAYVGKTKQAAA